MWITVGLFLVTNATDIIDGGLYEKGKVRRLIARLDGDQIEYVIYVPLSESMMPVQWVRHRALLTTEDKWNRWARGARFLYQLL